MGVPRFFRYITTTFPKIVSNIKFSEKFTTPVTHLYLDANGIIHNCANENYTTDSALFSGVIKYIHQLRDYVKPTGNFYIALDGIAPVAKQAQQRQRRYKNALTGINESAWNSTCVTPGTPFMQKLTRVLSHEFKGDRIVYSGPEEPGEGEHKITEWIRNSPTKKADTHCMYGLDADLFMLSLATGCPNFYLLREDVFHITWDDTFFHLVDIRTLRDELCESMQCARGDQECINDFVFLSFLAGNDFLHALPPLHDLQKSITLLLQFYTNCTDYITCGEGVRMKILLELFEQLATVEAKMISESFSGNRPNLTLNSSLINPRKPRDGISLDAYRKGYYKKACVNNIDAFCKDYLQGLDWVQWYYHKKCTNWRWYYPHHYSPLVTDLVRVMRTPGVKLSRVSNKDRSCVSEIVQLLSVIPPAFRSYIPESHRHIYDGPHSHLFPREFKIDLEGKYAEWEGIALLPFISIELDSLN